MYPSFTPFLGRCLGATRCTLIAASIFALGAFLSAAENDGAVASIYGSGSAHANGPASEAFLRGAAPKAQMSGSYDDGVVSLQINLVPTDASQDARAGLYRLLIVDAEGSVLAESDPQPVYAGKLTKLSFVIPDGAAQIQLLGPNNAVSAHLNVQARGYDRS